MQGMESGLHSLVSGPRSSGKEEMIGGIAQLLGRFLFTYSCTAHSDTHTLSRITEGLAQVKCTLLCMHINSVSVMCVEWGVGLSD